MKLTKWVLLTTLCLSSVNALSQAVSKTGIIKTVMPNRNTGVVLVKFESEAVFNVAGCENTWVAGSLDDEYFVNGIYPVLLAAKVAKEEVVIVSGSCLTVTNNNSNNNSMFPQFNYVELGPR